MGRSLSILISIAIGLLAPAAGQLSFLIRYCLMAMLFLSFLEIRFSGRLLRPVHLVVVVLNIALPLAVFAALRPLSADIALAAFAVAAMPTAAVAPAMAGFLHGNVPFVTAAVLLNNTVVALALPFTLPLVIGHQAEIEVLEVAIPAVSIVFLPLFASLALRWGWPAAAARVQRLSHISFAFFLFTIFVAAASASRFAREQGSGALGLFAAIGLVSALICLLHFRLGQWIGRRGLPVETGLSLGRKNTMFGIWLALTFISPVAAMGPMFYILFQNLYDSWQLYRMRC